jgi:GT2 family glycosyltransferase
MLYQTKFIETQIDILLLTYNNIENTKKCINLLYEHTEDFGLLIFDNKSNDGTIEFLKDLGGKKENISLYFNDRNIGVIDGRNAAYKELFLTSVHVPEYLMFIDNDQFVTEGWKESYFEFVNSGFDVVGTEAWKMRMDFYPFRKITDPSESFNYTGCGGMVMRKTVVDAIGLFDDFFSPMYFEDPDFCWRAFDAGYKVGWNWHNKIIHKPHRLLGENEERKKDFMFSWQKFQNKWKNRVIPQFTL